VPAKINKIGVIMNPIKIQNITAKLPHASRSSASGEK
jgi:hypothetical protein